MKPELGFVLSGIMTADSLDEVWAQLAGYFAGQGFGAVAYVLFNKGGGADEFGVFIEEGFAPAVVNAFAELGHGRNAPLLRVAMSSGRPHLATRVPEEYPLSLAERTHREAIVAAGLVDALALPLFGPGGRNAAVIVSEPIDPGLYDALDWAEMQIVAQAAHTRSFAVLPSRQSETPSLSRRELEILRWVAQGKSNGVIAAILALAPGTVDTYLRRVFEKLGVADRTSAAVRGVSMGLIRP